MYDIYLQVTPLKDQVAVPEMMSTEEEEEEAAIAMEQEKLIASSEERRSYSEKAKRAVRRKTHSPKRHQKQPTEMPILDERYAASLLEYYSKHKPYYPVDSEFSRHMEAEAAKVNEICGVLQCGVCVTVWSACCNVE